MKVTRLATVDWVHPSEEVRGPRGAGDLNSATAPCIEWIASAAFGAVAAGYQIRLEERYMAVTFGEESERYRRRVRRWLRDAYPIIALLSFCRHPYMETDGGKMATKVLRGS